MRTEFQSFTQSGVGESLIPASVREQIPRLTPEQREQQLQSRVASYNSVIPGWAKNSPAEGYKPVFNAPGIYLRELKPEEMMTWLQQNYGKQGLNQDLAAMLYETHNRYGNSQPGKSEYAFDPTSRAVPREITETFAPKDNIGGIPVPLFGPLLMGTIGLGTAALGGGGAAGGTGSAVGGAEVAAGGGGVTAGGGIVPGVGGALTEIIVTAPPVITAPVAAGSAAALGGVAAGAGAGTSSPPIDEIVTTTTPYPGAPPLPPPPISVPPPPEGPPISEVEETLSEAEKENRKEKLKDKLRNKLLSEALGSMAPVMPESLGSFLAGEGYRPQVFGIENPNLAGMIQLQIASNKLNRRVYGTE